MHTEKFEINLLCNALYQLIKFTKYIIVYYTLTSLHNIESNTPNTRQISRDRVIHLELSLVAETYI